MARSLIVRAERSHWFGEAKFDTAVFQKEVRAKDFLREGLLFIYHNTFIGIDAGNTPIYNGLTSL